MKRLLMLVLVLCLCASAIAFPADASGNLDTAGPTKAEIQQKWKEVTSATSLYEEEPSVSTPYTAGVLTDNFLESGITYLNYVRYVANLPAVQLNDTLNEDAQYGAVVLAANDVLTHYPEQPADMDDTFYERAYAATTSSNISARYGYAPLTCLQGAVSGCMADSGDNNLATVGHRRWLLNPTLLNVGFGYAEAESGWSYIVTKVFDRSGSSIDYDFISWPTEGNHPTNLFSTEDPWSITLNPSKYTTPDASEVKITITRQSDGKTWSFDSSTGQPTTHSSAYMLVNTNGYGVSNCIIFHPGSSNIDDYDGIFNVEVSGIYDSDGSAATLSYQVDFFDVEATCFEHNYETTVTQPTCTAQGYTTYTCSTCGDSYSDSYTAATGHSYGNWYTTAVATCTAAGTQQQDCQNCDHYETKEIAATEHSYSSKVTTPTCTAQGYTTFTCSVCGGSYKDAYTTAKGHSYGSWTTTKAATCTAAGTQRRDCKNCSKYETKTVAATGHNYVQSVCTVCGDVSLSAPAVKAANISSSGQIKISWNAVEGAEKYELYRASSKNGTYSRILSTTAASYTDTAISAGSTRYYYVRAIAADGSSAESSIVGRTCDLPRPTVTVSNKASTGKVVIKWTAVEGATKYQVYRATSKNGTYTRLITTKNTSITNTSTTAGETYYYKVRALCDVSAATSAYSSVKSRTCDLARPTVTVSNKASTGKIVVKWEAVEGATKYQVYRATSKNGTYTRIITTKNTSITNTSTTAGKTYYYKVRAVCDVSAATSAYSSVKSRTCDLERPDVSITRSGGKPKLSWDKVDGAVSYKVYRATSKTGTYSLVKTTTSRSWKDANAKAGKTYYYKVVAVCSPTAGNSAYSSVRYIKSK